MAVRTLEWLDKHQRIAALAACFVLFMALHHVADVQSFRWDAGSYWGLSSVSSLADFPAQGRGYFYPLLLAPIRYVSDLNPGWGMFPYRIFSSAIYAYIFAIMLPTFYRAAFGGQVTFWRTLVVPVLISIIFPASIVYPLSDLPASCLMVGAILCGMRSVTSGNPAMRHALLFLCGMLIYGVYNTRTLYLFPAAALVIAVPLVLYRGQVVRLRVLAILVLLAGGCIAAIPQSLVNIKNRGEWTPMVMTTQGGESLFDRQLLWGIVAQRYETTLDPSAPKAAVVYSDPAGRLLVQSFHIKPNFTVGDYLAYVASHPLDFAGIYGRHVINGLDVRDGGGYSAVLSSKRSGLAAFNFLVVFLGFAIMTTALFRHPPLGEANLIRLLLALLPLLPVLMIIPGAIETRFFLPLHLAIYSVMAFSADLRQIAGVFRRRWPVIVPAFALSASIFFAVSMSALSNIQYGLIPVHTLFEGTAG
jgi:hypothetical protein